MSQHRKPFRRAAKTIGINMMSGGMGKNELNKSDGRKRPNGVLLGSEVHGPIV